MTKTDLFLIIFEAIPGTLKRFETLYNVETMKVDLGRNVGLVFSLWRFVVSSFCYGLSSSVSARRFLKSTRRITSWIRRLVSFVGCRRFVTSFHRFVMSFRPFVMAFRLVQSERLKFDVHYMKCLLDSMHLYTRYLFIISYVPIFEELLTATYVFPKSWRKILIQKVVLKTSLIHRTGSTLWFGFNYRTAFLWDSVKDTH